MNAQGHLEPEEGGVVGKCHHSTTGATTPSASAVMDESWMVLAYGSYGLGLAQK